VNQADAEGRSYKQKWGTLESVPHLFILSQPDPIGSRFVTPN
jgi:hypothetical protein